jgi:threonine dehydratase
MQNPGLRNIGKVDKGAPKGYRIPNDIEKSDYEAPKKVVCASEGNHPQELETEAI